MKKMKLFLGIFILVLAVSSFALPIQEAYAHHYSYYTHHRGHNFRHRYHRRGYTHHFYRRGCHCSGGCRRVVCH